MKPALRRVLGWGFAGAVAVVGALVVWIAWPLPDGLLANGPVLSLTLEDRFGVELRSTRAADGTLARWVPLQRIDADVLRAFVALEDRRFFQHAGVDPRAVLRAARDNAARRSVVSGASTVTMQLARLLRGIGRDWVGKLEQSLWALRLERHLTKQQILEQYLNRVPLGQGAIGVAAAADLYFNASAGSLSVGQAALLAGLAHSPSGDNPLVSVQRARARREVALRRLVEIGYVTATEAARAAQEPVLSNERRAAFLAPHFTTHLLEEAEESGRQLNGRWRTSLDLGLQAELEAEVRHTVKQLADRGARQAAVVVLANGTGELLAWVGSPDFWADTAGQVDMVISPRQPGSALKPFLYGLAFDRGFTPATVLADIARTYQTSSGPYHPRNYDRRFHGPVRIREALGSSYNLPAVELADRIGFGTLYHGLHDAGFASLDRSPEHYGLGLALGNGDVTLLELANGYRALANLGRWRPTRWLAASPDPAAAGDGDRRVMSPSAAVQVLDILSDPVARIPGFGLETPFDFPFRAAAKSGTSRHFTDNWAVAVTGNFTVATWAGNFSGRPMDGVSGVSGAGPLLHRSVLLTARRYPPGDLPTPSHAGLVPVVICRLSGARAQADCPQTIEWFVPGTEPDRPCVWHRNGRAELPAEFAEWRETDGVGSAEATATRAVPSEAAAPLSSSFRIISPQNGDQYRAAPGVDTRYATLALRASGAPAGARVDWFIDGRPVSVRRWRIVPGRHAVEARTHDGLRDRVEIEVD